MYKILRMNSCGTKVVPDDWSKIACGGINRMYYIHKGTGTYEINGKKYPFLKNTLYFFPYTYEPIFKIDMEDKIFHTYTDFEFSPPIISNMVLSYNPHNDPIAQKALETFIEISKKYNDRHPSLYVDNSRRRLCFAAVSHLLTLTIESYDNIKTADDNVVNYTLEQMIKNIDKPFSVTQLAQNVYLTPDALIRRFKKHMGVTPYAYFKNIRLSTARSMLSEGHNLSFVASSVGYSDASSLLHALNT